MIEKALDVLRKRILEFLRQQPELSVQSEEKIQLQPLPAQDNNSTIPKDILCMTLVNIEEERVFKSNKTKMTDNDGKIISVNPEIKLNLYILISSHFDKYTTGLNFLSAVIRFFQTISVFTRENTPSLNSGIEKLVVELYTLDFEQQNHLWGALGSRYLPSVMYKVRLLRVQEQQTASMQEPTKIIDIIDDKS